MRACGPLRKHGPENAAGWWCRSAAREFFLLAAVGSGPCLLRDPPALTVASSHPWLPATGIHAGTTHPYPPAFRGRPTLGVARDITPDPHHSPRRRWRRPSRRWSRGSPLHPAPCPGRPRAPTLTRTQTANRFRRDINAGTVHDADCRGGENRHPERFSLATQHRRRAVPAIAQAACRASFSAHRAVLPAPCPHRHPTETSRS